MTMVSAVRSSVTAMLTQLDWSTLEQRWENQRLTMTYKVVHGLMSVSTPQFIPVVCRLSYPGLIITSNFGASAVIQHHTDTRSSHEQFPPGISSQPWPSKPRQSMCSSVGFHSSASRDHQHRRDIPYGSLPIYQKPKPDPFIVSACVLYNDMRWFSNRLVNKLCQQLLTQSSRRLWYLEIDINVIWTTPSSVISLGDVLYIGATLPWKVVVTKRQYARTVA